MKELFLAVIAAVIVGGTGLSAGEITAEDAVSVTYRNRDGVESVLNKEPERVIIGFGSFIDLWYASGGEAVAIPKLSEDKVPDYCRNLHQIGHFSTLNPETIIMLKPDLVLLDIQMPGLNGADFMAELSSMASAMPSTSRLGMMLVYKLPGPSKITSALRMASTAWGRAGGCSGMRRTW